MTKTLVIILNHNLPEMTDSLYLSLKDHEGDLFSLFVMDNGSKESLISPYTQVYLKQNIFWGGALNEAFKIMLDNDQYDSLLFLNNDIELNGKIFVEALRHELFANDFALVSPCIAGDPKPWLQMQNWGAQSTRVVKWIDNQAPMFHRKLVEAISQFDNELFYGWGQELICFDVCESNQWKIGVCDHVSIVHYKGQTLLQNRLFSLSGSSDGPRSESADPIDFAAFKKEARASYLNFFQAHPLKNSTFDELYFYGQNYYYHPLWK
jgi:hypothetical protein